MRFTMTEEGVKRLNEMERLNLDPGQVCVEFSGPSVREGLLGGFTRGELGWAKKALKISRTDGLDLVESRLLYYVLSMRHVNHALLPITHFDKLALTDFEQVQHVVPYLDRDGDCGECLMSVHANIHLDPEPADGDDDGELPPTQGSPATESATPMT